MFDPRPKRTLKDIFDREKEIELLKKSLDLPFSVVFGLRRTGKTSLILSLLNSMKISYFVFDMRVFSSKQYFSYKHFLQVLEKEINKKLRKMKGIEDFLKGIKGVSISTFSINFSWDKETIDFDELLTKIDEYAKSKNERIVIVIDEAQELIKLRGYNILPTLAYAYDHLSNLTFIITGSQVRVYTKFLKLDDAESPLYGRLIGRIQLHPFDKETAINFLKKGFEEYKITFNDYETVYKELGGNPGWLTYFGYLYINGYQNPLEETKKVARRLLLKEFNNFLKEGERVGSRKRYERVIRTCKNGCSWSEIKNSLEALEGKRLNDNIVYTIINNLIEYSFLIKENEKYFLADKLLAESL